MNSFLRGTQSIVLAIATWMIAPVAIARPVVSAPSFSAFQANRLARDLAVRSPSEDFFRQGRLQLEREIQLARKRQLLTKEVLKVGPTQPQPQDFVPNSNSENERRDR